MSEPFVFHRLSHLFSSRFLASFDRLEADPVDYRLTDVCSRFRRFGAFRASGGRVIYDAALETFFNHMRPFHARFDARSVAPLLRESLDGGEFEGIVRAVSSNPILGGASFAVGVNQVRVVATPEAPGSTAPGLHQDGYDFSCHVAVSRRDVSGGVSVLSRSPLPQNAFFERCMEPGEFLLFDDRRLYHTATAILPAPHASRASRDMVILDFVYLP